VKIIVDRTKCTGLGICESLAPDIFEVNDDGDLVLKTDEVPGGQLADVESAVSSCPTEALRIAESGK
jgi:ferredoxin